MLLPTGYNSNQPPFTEKFYRLSKGTLEESEDDGKEIIIDEDEDNDIFEVDEL
ncbi:13137_t:CDS:2, partial [Funneliformis caledonium]